MDSGWGWRPPAMSQLRLGLIAGLAFGLLDLVPMAALELPNRTAAMAGAFTNRFAIGLLIPLVVLPGPAWIRGLVTGLLMSAPDAIITGAWAPILGIGAAGGAAIGAIAGRAEQRRRRDDGP